MFELGENSPVLSGDSELGSPPELLQLELEENSPAILKFKKLGEILKFKKLGEILKFKKLGEILKFKKLGEILKFKI